MVIRLKYMLFLILATVMISCYNNEQKSQEFDLNKVISEEKMTAVLTDFFLIEGVVNMKVRTHRKVIDSISREYFDAVLIKHQLTKEEFDESMLYYTYHIEDLDKIYEAVITNLSVMESEVSRNPE